MDTLVILLSAPLALCLAGIALQFISICRAAREAEFAERRRVTARARNLY